MIYDLGGGTFDVSVLTIEDGIFEVTVVEVARVFFENFRRIFKFRVQNGFDNEPIKAVFEPGLVLLELV